MIWDFPTPEEQDLVMMDRIRKDIEEGPGWSAISVFGEDGNAPFTYTIGLMTTFNHPELIIYGLLPEQAHSILYSAIVNIKKGIRFEAGQRSKKVIAEFECEFREHPARPANWAHAFYEHEVPVLQLVWPDQEGRFPGEEGADKDFASQQVQQDEE